MHSDSRRRDQVVDVEPEVEGEEEPVLDRPERDRRDRRLGDLAADRRALAGKDPAAQQGEVDRERRGSAPGIGASVSLRPATSWKNAVAAIDEDEAERRGDRVAAEVAEGGGHERRV